MKSIRIMIGVVISCFVLVGCGKNSPIGEYDAAEVGKVKKVVPGTIISMRPVHLRIKDNNNLNGGSDITGDRAGEDNGFNQTHGFEYVIKLHSGAIISLVQAENLKLKNKQAILVIYGDNTRIVPDNGQVDY